MLSAQRRGRNQFAQRVRFPRAGASVALQVQDLTISFGGVIAVNEMALGIEPGEIVGLIGPNGAGKTTFINCVAGAYRPSRGRVT
jgi:branched-chain amino acid transport system ATP-binding protein